MKILHTSDWHVDLHHAQLGDAATAAREARWRALERLVEIAEQQSVDLVLIAGDTFNSVDADDDAVRRVAELLNQFAPAQVVVLPGNHDPLIAGGVWDRGGWRVLADHVTLIRSPDEVPLRVASRAAATAGGAGSEAGFTEAQPKDDGEVRDDHSFEVAIYPCPIRQKQSKLDPTEIIPARSPGDQRLRIGLAHGSLDVLAKVENFPIAQDRGVLAGLDYLALGDWHGQRVFGSTTAYSGSPEPTSFAENHPGRALLVQLDPNREAAPGIEPVSTGQCRWLQRDALLRDATDLAELEADLLSLGSPENALVRLRIRLVQDEREPSQRQSTLLASRAGEDGDGWVETVERFRAKWDERLLWLDWHLDELRISSNDLPRGLRSIDGTLRQALDAGGLDEELADLLEQDPAVLREARWYLRMLSTETSL